MAKRRSLSDRVTDSFRVLTELDLSHAYERQAGTIALIVLGVAIVVALIVTGGRVGGSDRIAFEAEVPSAGGLASGDPVLVRGVPVGRVEGVDLIGPGHVRVRLSVDPAYAPRRDASVVLVALDLVGSQGIMYERGVAADPLPADVPVVGAAPETLAEQ
ncbi:MAG: MlaD family protein, partial [Gemmatimonadota bacterium]|nr:MlaD family protein [Gemmatimonadota bacterium]